MNTPAAEREISLALPAHVVHATAPAVLRQLQDALAAALPDQGQGGTVTVDGADLQRFDSSVLAVLLALSRLLQRQSYQLTVQHVTPRLEALAKVYGVHDLLVRSA